MLGIISFSVCFFWGLNGNTHVNKKGELSKSVKDTLVIDTMFNYKKLVFFTSNDFVFYFEAKDIEDEIQVLKSNASNEKDKICWGEILSNISINQNEVDLKSIWTFSISRQVRNSITNINNFVLYLLDHIKCGVVEAGIVKHEEIVVKRNEFGISVETIQGKIILEAWMRKIN